MSNTDLTSSLKPLDCAKAKMEMPESGVLHGIQRVDGVYIAPGDRVFVTNRDSRSLPEIFIADEGYWQATHEIGRSFGSEAVWVYVSEGEIYGQTSWIFHFYALSQYSGKQHPAAIHFNCPPNKRKEVIKR